MIYNVSPSRGLAEAYSLPGFRPVRRRPYSGKNARFAGGRARGHGLGAVTAPQILGASAPIAGVAAGAAVSSLAAGTTLGSFAGPIGAAVGAVIGIIAGLFAAHDARAAGAKNENSAVAALIPAFDQGLQAIFQQANGGTISAAEAIQACQSLIQTWWTQISPYQSGPGRADASGHGANCGTPVPGSPCTGMVGGHFCDKSCTAGCCVGCQDLQDTIDQAIAVFQNGGGTVTACTVAGDKYGLTARPSYTLTYAPPAGAAGVAASLGLGSLSLPLLLLIGGGVALAAGVI